VYWTSRAISIIINAAQDSINYNYYYFISLLLLIKQDIPGACKEGTASS